MTDAYLLVQVMYHWHYLLESNIIRTTHSSYSKIDGENRYTFLAIIIPIPFIFHIRVRVVTA